jgi:hypothetical protein
MINFRLTTILEKAGGHCQANAGGGGREYELKALHSLVSNLGFGHLRPQVISDESPHKI